MLEGANSSYSAYCDVATGGWELVLTTAPFSTTFGFSSPLWENNELLNCDTASPTANVDSKCPGFVMRPVAQVRACAEGSCLNYTLPGSYVSLATMFATIPKSSTSNVIFGADLELAWPALSGWDTGQPIYLPPFSVCLQMSGLNYVANTSAPVYPQNTGIRFGALVNNECTVDYVTDFAFGFGALVNGITTGFGMVQGDQHGSGGAPAGITRSPAGSLWIMPPPPPSPSPSPPPPSPNPMPPPLPSPPPPSPPSPEPPRPSPPPPLVRYNFRGEPITDVFITGDCDGDGYFTITDASLAFAYANGMAITSTNETQMLNCVASFSFLCSRRYSNDAPTFLAVTQDDAGYLLSATTYLLPFLQMQSPLDLVFSLPSWNSADTWTVSARFLRPAYDTVRASASVPVACNEANIDFEFNIPVSTLGVTTTVLQGSLTAGTSSSTFLTIRAACSGEGTFTASVRMATQTTYSFAIGLSYRSDGSSQFSFCSADGYGSIFTRTSGYVGFYPIFNFSNATVDGIPLSPVPPSPPQSPPGPPPPYPVPPPDYLWPGPLWPGPFTCSPSNDPAPSTLCTIHPVHSATKITDYARLGVGRTVPFVPAMAARQVGGRLTAANRAALEVAAAAAGEGELADSVVAWLAEPATQHKAGRPGRWLTTLRRRRGRAAFSQDRGRRAIATTISVQAKSARRGPRRTPAGQTASRQSNSRPLTSQGGIRLSPLSADDAGPARALARGAPALRRACIGPLPAVSLRSLGEVCNTMRARSAGGHWRACARFARLPEPAARAVSSQAHARAPEPAPSERQWRGGAAAAALGAAAAALFVERGAAAVAAQPANPPSWRVYTRAEVAAHATKQSRVWVTYQACTAPCARALASAHGHAAR
jgi:hypothetical protein